MKQSRLYGSKPMPAIAGCTFRHGLDRTSINVRDFHRPESSHISVNEYFCRMPSPAHMAVWEKLSLLRG